MKIHIVRDDYVDEIVIDATKSHLQCLGPLIEWVCSLKHLVPNWQGHYTHNAICCSHHLTEDDEDPIDGVEDTKDGTKAFVDDGESLYGSEKH